MRGAVNKIGGECTARRIAPTVSQFGLQDAGGAGADEYPNPLGPVFFAGGRDGIGKAVLRQAQLREAVVSAIKVRQGRGKPHVIDTRDFTRESGQIDRIKRAWRQPTALLAQRREGRFKAASDGAGRGEMGKPERVQKKTSRSKCGVMLANSGDWAESDDGVADFFRFLRMPAIMQ